MSKTVSGTVPVPLDVMTFPLRGSRLIEASAGTGKTFTIAALYVRLVLGHGGEAGFERPLTPPEILVVTFTDASTKELRDRIRARLAEAAAYFLADPATVPEKKPGDDVLHDLRAQYPANEWPANARKLHLAAEWMDEAAVSTIHSWCNRMLREHAFDSDSLFTQTLETDQSELLAEVVRDYWRNFMYPLGRQAADEVAGWWETPMALQKALKDLIEHTDLLAESSEPEQTIGAYLDERRRRLNELKAPWATWPDELQQLFDEARANNRFEKAKFKQNNCNDWLETLREWYRDSERELPTLSDAAWKRLCPSGIAEIWKDDNPPQHPALESLATLRSAFADMPDVRGEVLRHAAHWVARQFADEQARHGEMGFHDLLTRLDAALQGPNALRLAELIRSQFPVALIDEFQDTDAVQLRIFDAVYRVEENNPRSALILIGDPKQAIYRFRGADIYTYLDARASTGGRHYTLGRNFRSTAAMVAATNRCFEFAESRPDGAGAFMFRTEEGNQVPFFPADAAGRKDALCVDGGSVAALTVWCLPADDPDKDLGKTAYLANAAQVCASEIVRLLNLGREGKAGFTDSATLRPLRPADVAVLVSNRNEAASIREALAKRGVRSVYLSERDSVFDCPEALELQLWLEACADPYDGRAVRAALATATLGLSWDDLDLVNRDELAWEARVLQFRDYRDVWRRQGVLPMLRRLLNDFRVPSRLLADSEGAGERVLTDVLHLAELLQQASALLDGEHSLIRYLAEQRQTTAEGNGDAQQIRLESDADLVQVVTVFKSKGLEYPLVFLPFACAYRATDEKDLPLKWHDDAGNLRLSLRNEGEALVRADRERLGDDLRKLYVALTRARYATWIGAGPIDGFSRSALGYLVSGGDSLAPAAVQGAFETLATDCPHIAVVAAPKPEEARYHGEGAATAIGAARGCDRAVRERWWIASYSSINTLAEAPGEAAETLAEEVFREASRAQVAAADRAPAVPAVHTASAGGLHRFPKGADVGTFLHDLLEWVANQGFAVMAGSPQRLRDAVARRCTLRGWQSWIDPLTAWLERFLRTELPVPAGDGSPATAFALAGLTVVIAEMEFWLEVRHTSVDKLDALVCRHTLGNQPRPKLMAAQLNGMLKGYIDLVVEHQGRYYVLDYKSNWLGPDDAAYTAERMCQEVLDSRYELQYVLYLVALHRLLKLRLPDYNYDTHIGGALYLFLRGTEADTRGVHAERPPRQLIETLDAWFAQAVEKEPA